MARIRMRKQTNKQHLNWLTSIAINIAIIAIVLLCTEMMYETNDDFGISEKIASGYPYIGFVNYYLCRALVVLQNLLPNVNIFVVSQLALSFVAFVIALKVILDRSSGVIIPILTSAVILIFSLDHYSSIQFTKTAALLMACGLLFLVDNYLHERYISHYILAFILFYVGVAFRQKGMMPALAFAGLYVVIWIIINRKSILENNINLKKETALALMLIIVALVPYGLDIMSDKANASTPALKTAREYQAERVKITDYPVYDYYEENKVKYDAIGLDENDIYLVTHWFLDYNGAASYDNLRQINEINEHSIVEHRSIVTAAKKFCVKTLKSIKDFGFTGIHIMILAILAIIVVLLTKPRNWIYLLAIGALSVGIYVVLYYLQRPAYRAFYIVDISATLWLLYVLACDLDELKKKKIGCVSGLLATILCCALMLPAMTNLNEQYTKISNKIESREFVQFYKDNADQFYVCATSSKKRHPSYLNPLEVPEVEKNATGLGGWGTLSPYELDQLSEYGLTNLVGDIINKENVYFLGTTNRDKIEQYYNKWYCHDGEHIYFKKTDIVDNQELCKVVKNSL